MSSAASPTRRSPYLGFLAFGRGVIYIFYGDALPPAGDSGSSLAVSRLVSPLRLHGALRSYRSLGRAALRSSPPRDRAADAALPAGRPADAERPPSSSASLSTR